MDNGIAELLDSFCQEHEYEFRPAYSGRGMYDATCPGIVADKNGFDLALELAEYALEQEAELYDVTFQLRGSRTDNMGLSSITYFPYALG